MEDLTLKIGDAIDAAWLCEALNAHAVVLERRAADSQAKAERLSYSGARTRSENSAADNRVKAATCRKYAEAFDEIRKAEGERFADVILGRVTNQPE